MTFWALQGRSRSGPAPELMNTEAKTMPDGLASLPRDYAGLPRNVPKLGRLARATLAGRSSRPRANCRRPAQTPRAAHRPGARSGAHRQTLRDDQRAGEAAANAEAQRSTGAPPPKQLRSKSSLRRSTPTTSKTCRIASSPSSMRQLTGAP
jgi:type IV secretion system protein VirB10